MLKHLEFYQIFLINVVWFSLSPPERQCFISLYKKEPRVGATSMENLAMQHKI